MIKHVYLIKLNDRAKAAEVAAARALYNALTETK